MQYTIDYALGDALDSSTWYHAVCTYDNNDETLYLYIDGVQVSSISVSMTNFLHGEDMPLGLGNRPSNDVNVNPGQSAGSNHFVGDVDDFVLWNRSLTAEEISLLYSSDKPVADQGDGDGDDGDLPTVSPVIGSEPTPSPSVSTVPTSNSPTTTLPPSTPILLWSDPSTWSSGVIPSDGDDVIIPVGTTIAIDVSDIPNGGGGSLGTLTIDGTLVNHQDADFSISAETIEVTETGTLQVGTEGEPYLGHAVITLTGKDKTLLYVCMNSKQKKMTLTSFDLLSLQICNIFG